MTDFNTITACGECCMGCSKKLQGICPGCNEVEGRVPEWAESGVCRVYACCKSHNARFCGLCEEFPCGNLTKIISWNPDIIEHLSVLREEYLIIKFLIKAKQATYAGKGAETESSRIGSHDLIYEDGEYMYYDTYIGGNRFAGEEALWVKQKPYWSMNYAGRVTGDNFSGDFLKEALLHVPEDKPFRGPQQYENGDYTYTCDVEGDFEWFQGKETISYKGEVIYECYFHGGLIE